MTKRLALWRNSTCSGFQSDSKSSKSWIELFQLSELSLLLEVKYKEEQDGEPQLLGVLGDEELVESNDERRVGSDGCGSTIARGDTVRRDCMKVKGEIGQVARFR